MAESVEKSTHDLVTDLRNGVDFRNYSQNW